MSLYMKYLKGWCHVMSGDVTIHACMIHMIYLDMIAILYIETYGGPKQVCLTLMILISYINRQTPL